MLWPAARSRAWMSWALTKSSTDDNNCSTAVRWRVVRMFGALGAAVRAGSGGGLTGPMVAAGGRCGGPDARERRLTFDLLPFRDLRQQCFT